MAVLLAPLVERELEFETVEQLLAGARAGSGGAVVFEGQAGIGKSSLLAAARTAAAGDFRVLSARGGELERELPFGIVRQLLEPVLASDPAEREPLLAGAAALLSPSSRRRSGDEERGDVFGVARALLADGQSGQLSTRARDRRRRTLGGYDSLRWLIYLARRLAGVPLALVLATRSTDPGPVQELHDDLLMIPEVAVLEPGGLSEEAITLLAVQSLSAEPDPIFIAACQRATGGNPFLLLELFGELERRGIAPTRENASLAGQVSSQGVGRAVRSRLRRLPPGHIALARAIAVLGESAEPNLAAQLAGLDDDEASRAGDALALAAILDRARPFAFIHPLVRSSIYSELSARERAQSHARAARMLSEAGEAADRIAVHLLATDPSGDPETVNTLREAARGASFAEHPSSRLRTSGERSRSHRRRTSRRCLPTSWAMRRSVRATSKWLLSSSGRQLGILPMGRCAQKRRTRWFGALPRRAAR